MSNKINLKLDEAVVAINRSSPDTLSSSVIEAENLDVYYQIDECFGCPLEKYTTLHSRYEEFAISTKYKLHLELRDPKLNDTSICKFNNLSFNNQGHYQINLVKSARVSDSNLSNFSYDCSLQTLDDGQCLLCPLAILLTFLILVSIIENLYSRFVNNKRGKQRKINKNVTSSNESVNEQFAQVSQEADNRQESSCSNQGTEEEEEQQQAQTNNTDAHTDQASIPLKMSAGQRVDALDAFRGLTIAGMIMVNYGGAGFSILEHKPWDGLTCADLVFPFFIFSMGSSIAVSTRSLFIKGKSTGYILKKILRRSFILLLLGLCLNSKALNGASLYSLRLTGVLQRFSISYLVVAYMFAVELVLIRWIKSLSLHRASLISSVIVIIIEGVLAFNYLAIYIYITFYYEYSTSCPAGYIGPGGLTDRGLYSNCTGGAAAWLDRTLLGEKHLYNDHEMKEIFKTQVSHDPEGILGFSTSIILTLIGLQCGKIFTKNRKHKSRLLMLSQWILILALSSIAVIVIPINKRLWSITFVTSTAALAYLIISILYLFMDVQQCKRTFLLRLLVSAGKNSIFLYVGHSLLSGMLPWYYAVIDDSSHSQLLLRLTWSTFVWLLIAHYLANKKVFIKI